MLTVAWADSILPGLSGLTRAMFSVGRFVDAGSDGAAVFALPNAVHRDKCEAKRADVEHALEEHFGHAVPLRLVVDESGASTEDHNSNGRRAPGGRSRPGNRTSPAVSSEPGDPEEPIDLDALEDAPPDPRTPIDRIAEAFPGARVEAEE
jgi:hypothetical protein